MKRLSIVFILCLNIVWLKGQELHIKNDRIERVMQFENKVWRTVKFASLDGKNVFSVKSDEFSILPLNSNKTLTIADFEVLGQPKTYQANDTTFCEIAYKPLDKAIENPACPQNLTITYFAVNGQNYIRKKIKLSYNQAATVDRLEVERFINNEHQTGGGRGEPVFVGDKWFLGLEYPAGYSRRTDGNTPAAFGRYYDSVGNYSFIDLEERDVEANPASGLIRLMHFPGYAVQANNTYEIQSKTAVTGFADHNMGVQQAFMQYLASIWKAPRSFLNYNNWFDKTAKDLKGDNFVNVYKKYKQLLEPYNIKIDAMVPDNGWQDRKGIWQPLPAYFPNGDDDLVLLSNKLKAEGTTLGLWLSINNYTNNIDWAVQNGYAEAKSNKYFSQYGRYLSLSATKYKNEILKRVAEIAKKADITYFKHDFNELSDASEGNNHPPTERHGHEANLDVTLEVLAETRKVQPEIFQNLTNWIWFSPWWLQHADYLWMLAGDDGMNGNTPELSTKAMFSTDRDTYIWRMFGNPDDRPLIPVSRLMTHGILQTNPNEKNTSIQDWMDYVLMHYGRGTLLKEWYVSLNAMTPELWNGLATVHKWAEKNEKILNNVVFVGGRPDEGNAYGYMGWDGEKGILTARNTSPLTQKLIIPFDKTVDFYSKAGVNYKGHVVYPYQEDYPATLVSGKNMEIEIPGYSTIAVEFSKGKPKKTTEKLPPILFKSKENITTLTVPKDAKGRCELMIIGYPNMPSIFIDGAEVKPKSTSKAKLNNFASYAVSGMKSDKAKDWNMAGYDLLPYLGKKIEISYKNIDGEFESHILAERQVEKAAAPNESGLLLPTGTTRRQTVKLY